MWPFNRTTDPEPTPEEMKMDRILELVQTSNALGVDQTEGTEGDGFVTRLEFEEMGGRFHQLRAEFEENREICLRHLRRAGQKLARSEQLHDEEEDPLPSSQALPPVGGAVDLEVVDPAVDALQYARDRIRASGIDPL